MKLLKKTLPLVLAILLLWALAGCGVDDTTILSLDIAGQESQFSLADLQKLDKREVIYSTVNNFPTKKYVKAEGCSLAALLETSGLVLPTAGVITVAADDGYSQSFTVEQLLGDQSYYYDLGDNAHPVPALLAWAYSDSQDGPPAQAEAIDGLRLLLGQNGPHAPNAMAGVQNVTAVSIGVDAAPQLPPCEFALTADGRVEFIYENMDNVKIYYTTDGTDPNPATSPVYNPSTSNFQPELNAPLRLAAGTPVRAQVVAYGWLDSEIAVYEVQ